MRYLGGKFRQSKQIAEYVKSMSNVADITEYGEPFCGSLSSAIAVSQVLPGVRVRLSDANPYLMRFWVAAKGGFNPPETITESDYAFYNKNRPKDDPMTGYVGFACSFGGKFFGGAARTNGVIKPSWKNTMDRVRWVREFDVELSCRPYWEFESCDTALTYLDPPYVGRTPQSREVPPFDREHFVLYAESLPGSVIASEFINDREWNVVHNWGDTVVRHLNAKPADGTSEVLMRVK